MDARSEIHEFTDSINEIGTGYKFGKDFVLKASLYLTESLPIQYKVKNFNKTNLRKIEANWEKIKEALATTVRLISRFGFNAKNVVAPLALLPIALFLLKRGKPAFDASSESSDANAQAAIRPEAVAGLMLASGYYYPTLRADVPALSPPAIPVVGDVLRHTVSPLILRLSWPALTRVLFGPAPTPPAFNQLEGLVSRPEPIRASASESALLVPSAVGLAERAQALRVPVAIVAGSDDRFVGTQEQSHALHDQLRGSTYREVPGAGHMVHHTAPRAVAEAIDDVARRVEEGKARAA